MGAATLRDSVKASASRYRDPVLFAGQRRATFHIRDLVVALDDVFFADSSR